MKFQVNMKQFSFCSAKLGYTFCKHVCCKIKETNKKVHCLARVEDKMTVKGGKNIIIGCMDNTVFIIVL
jgi:hypothetical protein